MKAIITFILLVIAFNLSAQLKDESNISVIEAGKDTFYYFNVTPNDSILTVHEIPPNGKLITNIAGLNEKLKKESKKEYKAYSTKKEQDIWDEAEDKEYKLGKEAKDKKEKKDK